MNPLLKSVLGLREHEEEHEAEGGKLPKPTVVYLTPEQIGEGGAHCGGCFFFRRPISECFLTSPPKCDAEHGVCAYFIGGNLWEGAGDGVKMKPQELVSKEEAGYVTNGPTKCSSCEYFQNKGAATSPCAKVQGTVDAGGCCNAYELC